MLQLPVAPLNINLSVWYQIKTCKVLSLWAETESFTQAEQASSITIIMLLMIHNIEALPR